MSFESPGFSSFVNIERTTLGDVCVRGDAAIQIGMRIQLKSTDPAGPGIPYIMPENICNNRIDPGSLSRAIDVSAQDRARFSVQCGDILCSRRGDLNRYALIGPAEEGWLCGTGCLRLRFKPQRIDPLYAFYYLRHPDVCSWINRHAIGATMPHINKAILCNMPFVIPEIAEQRRIAELLSALEEKIALNAKINQNLMAAARGLFEQITKSWEPFGTPPENLPAGWRIDVLQNCCNRIENGRTPQRSEPRYWNGNIPWLTSGEVRQSVIISAENRITRDGLVKSSMKLWPHGTTIVAMAGTTAGKVAWLAMESTANQACCGLMPPKEMQLYIYLNMVSYAAVLCRFKKGSAQQNLNQQSIARFPVLIPDSATLATFDGEARPLFERIVSNLRESATLSALCETILPELFSNKSAGKSTMHLAND